MKLPKYGGKGRKIVLKVWAMSKKFTYVTSMLKCMWRYSDAKTFTCMQVCIYVNHTVMERGVITTEVEILRWLG